MRSSTFRRAQRSNDIAPTEYRDTTTVVQGLFLVLVGRAPGPRLDVIAKCTTIERKEANALCHHYSVHILDPDLGPSLTTKSAHPPFPSQVILNGHEYVPCHPARPALLTQEGNFFY